MEIVVLDGYTENPGDLSWSGFESFAPVRVYDRTPAKDVVKYIGSADIIINNKVRLTREILDACPSIRYIGQLSTGYDNVDIAAAKEKGIPVTNVPTYGTNAVGQFTIGLLLEICNGIGHHAAAVKTGRWTSCPDFCFWDFPLVELLGKTIGIIGFGRIGQATGRIAKAIGMKVLATDAFPNDSGREIAEYVSRDELFARADVIALHCNLTPETEGLINKNTIAGMKDGVIILNTARGPLVAERDLADALNSGKVRAAGLDVVGKEPIETDNPLLTAKNCTITPHIAWAPIECRQRIMDIAVNNLGAFLKGCPENVVNG